jgi:hypothetical protein
MKGIAVVPSLMELSIDRKSSKVSKGTMAIYDHHTMKSLASMVTEI